MDEFDPASEKAVTAEIRPSRRVLSFDRFAILLFLAMFAVFVVSRRPIPPGDLESFSPGARTKAGFGAFPRLDGGDWRLSDHRGKVVVVNLWATWCPPCRSETPDLIRLSRELAPKGLEVVGVAMNEGAPLPIRRFVEEFHIPYPIARGIGEPTFSVGVPLPTTMVFDRQGRLALRTIGAIDPGPFRDRLESLLAEPAR